MTKRSVTVRVTHTPVDRLEWVDKADWPQLIDRKATFVASALNEDLSLALRNLDELEENEAWKYLNMDRESFIKHRLHIEPADLETMRAGQRALLRRGVVAKSWREAVDAVKPLAPIKPSQRYLKFSDISPFLVGGLVGRVQPL